MASDYLFVKLNGMDLGAKFKRHLNGIKAVLDEAADKRVFPESLLIVADDGCGFTSICRYYSAILEKYYAPFNNLSLSFYEFELTKGNEKANGFGDSISFIENNFGDSGSVSVFCVDISNWINNKLNDPYLRKFLKYCYNNRNSNYFIFRMPVSSAETIKNVSETIRYFIPSITFEVPLPDNAKLAAAAASVIEGIINNLTKKEQFILEQIIEKKRNSGRFRNYKTAILIAEDIGFRLVKGSEEVNITPEDRARVFREVSVKDDAESMTGQEMLDSLIGLDNTKKHIKEIIASIIYHNKKSQNRLRQYDGDNDMRPNIHMLFTGAPGTGKTIVARIVGKILKENGVLKIGDLIEVTRKDLVGEYLGQTALKTSNVIKGAIGSVLFIDEAYSLTNETIDRKDFGFEAVTTLMSEMENRRGEFVVIMAGYETEMERLFEMNVGLKERFGYKLDFKNYTKEELYKIFIYQTEKNYDYADGFLEHVKSFFNGLKKEFMDEYNFANARFVRNLVERTVSKAVLRLADENVKVIQNKRIELKHEDFNNAVKGDDIVQLMKAKVKSIGFTFNQH